MGSSDCDAAEDRANNFIAIRRVYAHGAAADALYAEFGEGELGVTNLTLGGARGAPPSFVEYFEMLTDPEQLHNRRERVADEWPTAQPMLHAWHACAGASCP